MVNLGNIEQVSAAAQQRAADARATTAALAVRTSEATAAGNNFYVDPLSGKAATRQGAITKMQWADYQTRFVPIENQLMNMTTYNNPELAGQEIGKAQADTAGTYDNIAGSQAIQMGRYGMSLSPDQQASSDRINSLGKSGAVVDAANNIRLKLVERNQTIAAGTSQSMNVSQK